MLKKVCDFKGQKVGKTLIFLHTHARAIIGEQKKSPMAILTESTHRAIRWIRDVIFRHCEGVNPWQSSLRHCEPDKAWQSIRDCFVALLLAMTGKSGVIANAVKQSLNRLLRHFIPRNDGVFKNVLAMTSHPDVIPDLIGYPENKKSSCADVVRRILGSSPRMAY